MLSNHLIFCHPLLLLPSAIPSVRVFFNELALCIKWPKYWSFSFSTSRHLEIEHAFLSQDLQMGNWSPGCCEYIREGFHHWRLTEHRSHPVLVIIKEYLFYKAVDNREVISCIIQSWVGSAESQEKLRTQDGVSYASIQRPPNSFLGRCACSSRDMYRHITSNTINNRKIPETTQVTTI